MGAVCLGLDLKNKNSKIFSGQRREGKMECFKSVLEKLKGMRQEMGNLTSCKTCKTNTNDEDEHPPLAKKDPLLSHLTEVHLHIPTIYILIIMTS